MTTGAPENVAAELRAWLGWAQPSAERGTESQFARRVRADLEDRGLLVLHLSMGARGWRGFSLRSPDAPVIVANTHYNYRPRVFTYLHELVHLSADTESICTVRSDEDLERWCDRVASAMLMPADEVHRLVSAKVAGVDGVIRVANAFTVSLRAAAVRLDHLGLAAPGLYETVDAVAKVREVKKGGGTGGEPQTTPRVRLQTLGRGYVLPVLDAEADRVLTRTDAMELLDVTAGQLSDLRAIAATTALAEE
jgi:Zn-dependent peptidase ImmA (M78 family)